MLRVTNCKHQILTIAAFSSVFALAFLRVHMRVQSTQIGYEIGRLKTQEARLLEQRGELKMQLAKLTTKEHLSLMVSSGDTGKGSVSALAAK